MTACQVAQTSYIAIIHGIKYTRYSVRVCSEKVVDEWFFHWRKREERRAAVRVRVDGA